jgi:transposase
MFSLSATYRYYLYSGACDMRKGFDGLCGLVGEHFGQNLKTGAVYVFLNRRGDQLKLLHWECGGLVLYHKRLEVGRFRLPAQLPDNQELAWHDLVLLVEGIVVRKIEQSKRYVLKN